MVSGSIEQIKCKGGQHKATQFLDDDISDDHDHVLRLHGPTRWRLGNGERILRTYHWS